VAGAEEDDVVGHLRHETRLQFYHGLGVVPGRAEHQADPAVVAVGGTGSDVAVVSEEPHEQPTTSSPRAGAFRHPARELGLLVGRGGLAPNSPADLQPVHAGQVPVEEHEVGPAPHRLQPLLARAGDLDLEPHLLELIADGLRAVAVVLDEHHPAPAVRRGGGGGCGAGCSTSGPAIHLVSASRWWWRPSLGSTGNASCSGTLPAGP